MIIATVLFHLARLRITSSNTRLLNMLLKYQVYLYLPPSLYWVSLLNLLCLQVTESEERYLLVILVRHNIWRD